MKSLMPRISVDVWSDYVCPWCWIAKKRFEKGLEEFEYSKQVDVRHHSYRIASDHPLFHSDRLCIRSLVVSMVQS